MPRTGLLQRWGRRGLAALGLAATFVVAVVASIALHANLPLVRRLAAREVARAVSGVLVGRLEVAPFDELSFRELRIAKATLYDARGHRVLSLSNARIDFDPVLVLKSVLSKDAVLRIIVNRIRAEAAEAEIVPEPTTGAPTIVGAFAPRPSKSAPAKPGSGRKVRVVLADIEVRSGRLHATFRDGPDLEADLPRLRGKLDITPSGIAVDVPRVGARVRGLGTEARGTVTLNVLPSGVMLPTFAGFVGDVALDATARIDGRHLELAADIPSASPSAVRRFLPSWPLVEPVTAHVEAAGDLPELQAHARFALGGARVTAEGPVNLGEHASAGLQFSGEHLDLRALVPRAPATDLAVDGDLAAGSENGKLSASIRARSRETEVDGYPVPALDAEATIHGGAVSGLVDIHEPGMPTRATFRVAPGGAVDVDAVARAVDFRKARPLSGRSVTGGGGAHLRAHLEGGNLTASLEATTELVEIASVSIADARVSVQARGPLDALERLAGTAHVTAASVKRGAMSLENIEVDARGNLMRATFDARVRKSDGPEVTLAGTLAVLGHPLLRDTRISLRRDPLVLEGEISELDPETKTFSVRNVHATGAGGPLTGSLRVQPHLVEVDAEGENLDLAVLSRALGFPPGILQGRARVSVSFASSRDVPRGHVDIGAADLNVGRVGGISARLFADLDGNRLTGGASGLARELGAFGASWDVALSGSPLELASFRDATGTAELQVSDADLRQLDFLLSKEGPVEKVEGRGYAKIELSRKSTLAVLPSIQATLSTRRLAVVLRASEGAAAKRIQGIDVVATGQFDGESSTTSGETQLVDSHGKLASLEGRLGIDVSRLVHDPAHAFSELLAATIDARASAPPRRISDLPEFLRLEGVQGHVGGEVLVQGPLAHPTLHARFDGRSIVVERSPVPIDLHAEAEYDSASSDLRGRAEAHIAKASVATATLTGTLPAGTPSDFHGTARLDLNGLPLDLVGALSGSDVHGRLSGTATASKLEGEKTLVADLRVADMVISGTPMGAGTLRIATEGALVSASAVFSGRHGSLDARGSAGLSWSGPLPSLSTAMPVRGRVVTKDFSATAASPLVVGVLSRVEGLIDANVTVALDPKVDAAHRVDWTGRVDGSAVLRHGSMLIDALGVDIRNLDLSVRIGGEGNATHIAIADVKGSVRSETDNIHASANFDLEGLTLVRGDASVEAKDMPILYRGAPQGRVTGNVALNLKREPERMLVNADVASLMLKLPESSSRHAIDVAENPEVAIVQKEAPVEHRGGAFPWRIRIDLGNDVALQRSDIELKITGTPVIELGSKTRMTGSIALVPGGRLPVLGQVFVIDRGRITFDTPVPENPHLAVSAVWRAPNNTLVIVQVTGTAQDPQIALRSEPPLPEPEVFALIFGGSSADPSSADRPTGDQGSAAKTVALQSSAQQLNRLLGQSPVELRVGSTSGAKPRYSAAVRIRENLWFEASTYQQSEDSSGTGAMQTVVSGTIDYRFTRKWSLRTEAGTSGAAVDLLWQHRY